MRRFALITALLFCSSLFVFAQDSGNRTPPGGDMLGSDWHMASGINGNQRLDDDQSQRMSGTMGNTKGITGSPAYAGGSEYENTAALSSSGVVGEQGQTAAIAARLGAENPTQSAEDTAAIPQPNGGPTSERPMQRNGQGGGGANTATQPRKGNAHHPGTKR